MGFKIEFTDLHKQYKLMEAEIDVAIKKVLNSTKFINGPELGELETKLAQFCQTKFAMGVASGTDALLMPLMAINLQPGDEVITTPFTFIASAEVIALLKAKPVFVDIDPQTYNIDANKIEDKITKKTRAIIPVHLYGQMADMDKIMDLAKKYNLIVIEDACQSIGAEYKGRKACSMGDFGALSFFPAKNLGCYGDGGMVLTNNENYAKKIRMIRQHGSEIRYEHTLLGLNGRLDTLQCAILLVKMKYLNQWLEHRTRLGLRYSEQLKDYVQTPFINPNNKHVFNYYAIKTERRDELNKYLNDHGIPTAIYYPKPLHLQECFKTLGYKKGDLPISEKTSDQILSLPIYPEMPEEEQDMVVETVIDFFKK